MKIRTNKQRGFSFSGFIVFVVILIFAAIAGMKVIPAYMQNARVKGIFDTIAHDSAMQTASIKDIRESYAKRSGMDNITIINPADIEIDKSGGGISLSASYTVKVPLAGNASLMLEFSPSSTK